MRHALLPLLLLGACGLPVTNNAVNSPWLAERSVSCDAGSEGSIRGSIRNEATDAPLANALIILQSAALPEVAEMTTDEFGRYRFEGLPPGTYTLQVLVGQADVSRVVTLPEGAAFRTNFGVDPAVSFFTCRLCFKPGPPLDESLLSVTDEREARLLNMPKTRYGL